MQRYFIDIDYMGQRSLLIEGENFHHITRVMRMKKGDSFWVVFNNAKTALVEIVEIININVEVKIIAWEEVRKELPIHVSIASGLPKGEKYEWIIQKGTELGAAEFVPFLAERSVVKWEAKKADKKLARWNKIAKEAAEQSHRQALPILFPPLSLTDLISYSQRFDWKVLAYEEAAKENEVSNFAKVLSQAKPSDKMMIVCGPEGGISPQEKNQLENNGFILCGLGPRILRTETAPLYALAALSYQFELMR